jgi:CheY-like chemotaxis protein
MSPLHVLVVDDMPEIGELLSTILSNNGHLMSFCRSGAEALQKLRTSTRPFDLLITDHFMPGSLTGLDLVRLARARGFDRQIVATSGHFSPELKESYKAFAVLGFLPKPMDLKLLKALVLASGFVPRPSHGFQYAAPAAPVTIASSQPASSTALVARDESPSAAAAEPDCAA